RDAAVGGDGPRFTKYWWSPDRDTPVIGGTIWILAGRNNRKGGEVTHRYSTHGEGSTRRPCSPGCKRRPCCRFSTCSCARALRSRHKPRSSRGSSPSAASL